LALQYQEQKVQGQKEYKFSSSQKNYKAVFWSYNKCLEIDTKILTKSKLSENIFNQN